MRYFAVSRGVGSRRCDPMDAADVGELDSLLANLAADGGPVGGACPQIVDKLRHTIVGLKNEGLSMILNSSLALDVADDVALLDTTRITLEGLPKSFAIGGHFRMNRWGDEFPARFAHLASSPRRLNNPMGRMKDADRVHWFRKHGNRYCPMHL
jgi:hypothetical protein